MWLCTGGLHSNIIIVILLKNATAMSERSRPHTVLQNGQNFQLFPNSTFELQWTGYICMLCVDAVLHLAPPAGTKGRSYDICIDTGTLTSSSLCPQQLCMRNFFLMRTMRGSNWEQIFISQIFLSRIIILYLKLRNA